MTIGSILFEAGGGGLLSISNLVNGHLQRKMQRELHGQDLVAAESRFQRAESGAESRFTRQFDLASRQFEFTRLHARLEIEQRRQQHLDRLLHELGRDKSARLFDGLREILTISPDAWFDHDPLAAGTNAIPSLRVIVERPDGLDPQTHALIEHALATGVTEYQQAGADHPVFFPTGLWRRDAKQAGGSALTAALHAWNPRIPTLSLRPQKIGDEIIIQGDLFGFAMGERTYISGIEIAKVPAHNIKAVAGIITVAALGFADSYFLNQHGQGPLLPHVLAQTPALQAGEGAAKEVVGKLIASSTDTIKQLIADTPQAGLYVALQMAEDLAGWNDKSHALAMLEDIEAAVASVLSSLPEVGEKLSALYTKVGATEDAERIQAAIAKPKNLPRPDEGDNLTKNL